MPRRVGSLALAFALLGLCDRLLGQTTAVSDLHTVSVHVRDVETYNTAFRLLTEDFRWPLVFGKLLTPDLADKRNYAGIYAGNVRVEICGPYPNEFKSGDIPARLHGLTFRPAENADKSISDLDRRSVRHKGIQTWGGTTRFIIFDDPALIRPEFSISIMDVADRRADEAEQDRARAKSNTTVREVRILYEDDAALAKWKQFLDAIPFPGGRGPGLRLIKGPRNGIDALVLETTPDPKLLDRARALGINLVR